MRRVEYLDPSKKLVDEVVGWLIKASRKTVEGVHSLAHIMVIVPTAQSGRNLRLKLAEEAAKQGWGGILPPKTVMANTLLTLPDVRVGTEAEELATMASVLLDSEIDKWTRLFSKQPKARTVDWALAMAGMILEIEKILGESGGKVGVEEVAKWLSDEVEVERWVELAEIEGLFFERMRKQGIVPRNLARKQAVKAGCIENEIEEIILPAAVDIKEAFIEYLKNSNQQVSVLVHAKSEDAAKFDEWGRPVAIFAAKLGPEMIESSPNAVKEAEDIAKYFRAIDVNEALPALVVCDSEMYPELDGAFQNHFSEEELALRNPSRERLTNSALGRLLETILSLAEKKDYETFSTLIRMGDVARWASGELGVTSAKIAEYVGALDKVQNEYLPRTIEEVEKRMGDGEGEAEKGLLMLVRAIKVEINAPYEFIKKIFASRILDERNGSDRELIAAAEVVRNLREECNSEIIDERFRDKIFVNCLKSASFMLEPMAKNVLATTGWLEFQWCIEDEIVIAGFNEGCVPESVVGHPFLPDSLRAKLGLTCNTQRGYRDSFIFAEAVACRANGAVLIYLHQIAGDKNVVKPSRILFDGIKDEELPELARRLYAVTKGNEGSPSKQIPSAWRLMLPIPPKELVFRESISVTALNSYARCPFTFYLQEIFGQHPDDRNQELDAMAFGSLCHTVLEKFAKEGPKDSTDASEIAKFLTGEVNCQLQKFGNPLPVIIELQGEAAIARLEAFAKLQAARRRKGWKIVASEQKFRCRIKSCPTILTGIVDRIDQHEETGELAIIDYKTWKSAKEISDNDIQLPVYRAMVETSGKYSQAQAHSAKAFYCILAEQMEDVEFNEEHAVHEGMQSAAEDKVVSLLTNLAKGIYYSEESFNSNERSQQQRQFGSIILESEEQWLAEEWIADQKSRLEAK